REAPKVIELDVSKVGASSLSRNTRSRPHGGFLVFEIRRSFLSFSWGCRFGALPAPEGCRSLRDTPPSGVENEVGSVAIEFALHGIGVPRDPTEANELGTSRARRPLGHAARPADPRDLDRPLVPDAPGAIEGEAPQQIRHDRLRERGP